MGSDGRIYRRPKYGPEVTRALKEKFPKFSRVTLCMINNPEYGIFFSEEAESYLKRQGVIPTAKRPVRKKANRLSARVDDDTYRKIEEITSKTGQTMQQYLESLVKDSLKGD